MKEYTAVIEKCAQTELYVGYVPGILGAHSQGATLVLRDFAWLHKFENSS